MASIEARSFLMPGKIVYGEGALAQAAPSMAQMGEKALIVTDEMMEAGKPGSRHAGA